MLCLMQDLLIETFLVLFVLVQTESKISSFKESVIRCLTLTALQFHHHSSYDDFKLPIDMQIWKARVTSWLLFEVDWRWNYYCFGKDVRYPECRDILFIGFKYTMESLVWLTNRLWGGKSREWDRFEGVLVVYQILED